MARVKTIQEKREEMERQLKRLEAFEKAINKLEHDLHWDYCETKNDDEGNLVTDDNDDYIFEAPDKDSWRYEGYEEFKAVIDEIKALV